MIESQAQLDRQREELIQELIDMQPFRRGTLNHGVYRKCGKKTCVCTQVGHPGHGPIITLTHKKENKTKTRKINPGQVEAVQRQVDAHKFFLDWQRRWVELNEHAADRELAECVQAAGESDKKKLRKPSHGK